MNDPSNALNALWTIAQPFLSAEAATYVGAGITTLITVCSIIARFWKPPAEGTKMASLWRIVTYIAQARGWTVPAYQPGKKAVMVPVSTPRSDAAELLGVDASATRPAPLNTPVTTPTKEKVS